MAAMMDHARHTRPHKKRVHHVNTINKHASFFENTMHESCFIALTSFIDDVTSESEKSLSPTPAPRGRANSFVLREDTLAPQAATAWRDEDGPCIACEQDIWRSIFRS